jgi:hypothetical protein
LLWVRAQVALVATCRCQPGHRLAALVAQFQLLVVKALTRVAMLWSLEELANSLAVA